MKKDDIKIESETKSKKVDLFFELPEGVPPLHTFYLYITNECNLACRHCWITPKFLMGNSSPADFLNFNLLKAAVREAKTLGLIHAKLTGGEPLIHPRFIDIVDYLSNENIQLTLETNATLIDADMARHLKKNTTLWFVTASLDSVRPAGHDNFRGVQGAFNSALKGIGHLADAGFRPQIIMSLYRHNINEIEDMVRLAMKLGAGSVKLNPVTPAGRGKVMETQGETLNYDEIIRLVRYVKGELRERTSIPVFLSIPPGLSTLREMLLEQGSAGECRVLNVLGILGNGDMALCGIGRSIPELCFGKLGKDNLRKTWESHSTLVQLRKELKSHYPGICGDCIHSNRCKTHCVAMNYVRTGSLVHPDYLCEEAERRGDFPPTRRRSFKD